MKTDASSHKYKNKWPTILFYNKKWNVPDMLSKTYETQFAVCSFINYCRLELFLYYGYPHYKTLSRCFFKTTKLCLKLSNIFWYTLSRNWWFWFTNYFVKKLIGLVKRSVRCCQAKLLQQFWKNCDFLISKDSKS